MKPGILLACLALLCFNVQSFSQCGTAPASGATTIAVNSTLNTYYPVTTTDALANVASPQIVVGTSRGSLTTLAVGDLVVIMQMQGADITTTDSDAYGNGIAGGPGSGYVENVDRVAGNFEYNTVASIVGSTVTLTYPLTRSYYNRAATATLGKRTFQLIRVPRYYDITINTGVTVNCSRWDGASGGVVILEVANVFTINGTISVAGRGFRGGGGRTMGGPAGVANTAHRWISNVLAASTNAAGGAKGEGISGTPVITLLPGNTTVTQGTVEGYVDGAMGRGAPGNAGGGGTDGSPANEFNTGGGGGGNGGAGGKGGSGWYGTTGDANTYPTGGWGGADFAQRGISRLVMGGGGGAGSANNATGAEAYLSSGGTGGGVIIIRAKSYAGNGTLDASGGGALGITGSSPTDAAGGGGAGGSIMALTNAAGTVGLNSITANAAGGAGGNMNAYWDHGPGGGGGGGYIFTNGTFASTNVAGGSNGFTHTGNTGSPLNNAYGATAGSGGQVRTMLGVPPISGGGVQCGVLPVQLISFSGSVQNAQTLLRWETALETGFSHFDIEYSTDGTNFSSVGRVDGNAGPQYQFTHSNPAPVSYYRLRIVDIDASYSFSSIVVVRTTAVQGFSIKPLENPIRYNVMIRIESDVEEAGFYRIISSTGVLIAQKNINIQKGFSVVTLDDKSSKSAGTYTIEVITPSRKASTRILRSR